MALRPASRPYWLAAVVVALGVLCIRGALMLPSASRYAGIGPGGFALAIGVGLAVLGVILAVQIHRGATFEPQETEGADAGQPMNRTAFLLALAAAGMPILTLRSVGLPLTALVSFTLVARSFGSTTLLRDIVTGAIVGTLAWFLFDSLGLQLGRFFPFAGL